MKIFKTELYKRLKTEIDKIKIIDTHEHLQSESILPIGDDIHIGRFFLHYASSDLVSAGMPQTDMEKVKTDSSLSPLDRWSLLEPWYKKAWNTAYCESLRIAIKNIYGIDDFSVSTVEKLTEEMREAQTRLQEKDLCHGWN